MARTLHHIDGHIRVDLSRRSRKDWRCYTAGNWIHPLRAKRYVRPQARKTTTIISDNDFSQLLQPARREEKNTIRRRWTSAPNTQGNWFNKIHTDAQTHTDRRDRRRTRAHKHAHTHTHVFGPVAAAVTGNGRNAHTNSLVAVVVGFGRARRVKKENK